jgi:cytidylate kinase
MQPAADAKEIDTTHSTVDEVVRQIESLIRAVAA